MKRMILTLWMTCFLAIPTVLAGASRDFDGANDSIDLPADSNFGLDSGPATWAAWVRPTTFASIASQAIITKADPGYVRIYVKDDGNQIKCVKFLKDRSPSDLAKTTADNTLSLNTWHWVVVTWDGSLNSANVHIYINDSEPSYQENSSGSGTEGLGSAATWHLGNRESAGTAAPFDGQLAYVHFYNRVLSSSERTQIKNAPGSVTSGLVGYWSLTGSGSQELDASGNNQHGTVLGATESSNAPPISDTTPPTISNVATSNITDTTATVTWTTDENADSVVEYGLTTSYGQTTSDTALVTSHSIGLTGLSASTTYHYRVKSKDAANNLATSSDSTFQTAGNDATPPTNTSVLINGGAVATNSTSVTLTLSATDPSGVAQMRFSNDNGATWSSPETYSTSRPSWTLPSGDGLKTVQAKFSDTLGNWSDPVSDSIILDTATPSVTITAPQDGDVILP